jgi:hypothetical protein
MDPVTVLCSSRTYVYLITMRLANSTDILILHSHVTQIALYNTYVTFSVLILIKRQIKHLFNIGDSLLLHVIS